MFYTRVQVTATRRTAALVSCLIFVLLFAPVPHPSTAETNPEDAPAIELAPPVPATPVPVSGSSGLVESQSSYSTEIFDPEESLSPNGLTVYTSTAPGTFALTGTVIDGASGAPVSGASVTLETSTAAGGTQLEATADSDGAFAFVDVPLSVASNTFDFAVSAGGYGAYILRVAGSELYTSWITKTFRANAAAQQNFAWYHRIQGSAINNTTDYQCFKPWAKVPSKWRSALGDVLDERIKTSSGDIQITQYRDGLQIALNPHRITRMAIGYPSSDPTLAQTLIPRLAEVMRHGER